MMQKSHKETKYRYMQNINKDANILFEDEKWLQSTQNNH